MKPMFLHCIFNLCFWKIGHDCFANSRAVGRISASYARCQAYAPRRFDFVDVYYFSIIVDAEVDGLTGLEHHMLEKRPRLLTKVKLRDCFRSQLK